MPGGYGGTYIGEFNADESLDAYDTGVGNADWRNHRERTRLANAVDWSRRRLQPFREHFYSMMREYVGYHYSEDGAEDRVPLNMMGMGLNVLTRYVAATNPRAMIRTHAKSLKASAYEMELAADYAMADIQLGRTMREIVFNALCVMGIAKQGLADTQVELFGGEIHSTGKPFVDSVSFDDWVHDMGSNSWERVGYCGNRYRIPIDIAKSNESWNKGARDALSTHYKRNYNEEGDSKIETIGRGFEGDRDEYTDHVYLWDLYLPQKNIFRTVEADEEGGMSIDAHPLFDEYWDGPDGGPYHILRLGNAPPNSIIPVAPAMHWMDLHTIINRLYRKLARQAERQKKLIGARPTAGQDAEAIANANDGDVIDLDNPDQVHEIGYGGIDATNFAFCSDAAERFSYMAGNLDALAGLGPQSETLGQDRMLMQNASKQVQDLQERVIEFSTDVMRDLIWWMMDDPDSEIPITKKIEGTDIEIETLWTKQSMKGKFLDYNYKIEPYSMQHHSPGSRLQTLQNVMSNFVLPFWETGELQAQGGSINVQGLLDIVAKYTDMTELGDIIKFGGVSQMGQTREQVQGESGGRIPAAREKHTVSERRSIPGQSQKSNSRMMIQSLLAMDKNPSAGGMKQNA